MSARWAGFDLFSLCRLQGANLIATIEMATNASVPKIVLRTMVEVLTPCASNSRASAPPLVALSAAAASSGVSGQRRQSTSEG